MLAVPVNRTPQPGPQIDGRCPAGQLAQLGRVEVLVEDLPRRQPRPVFRRDLAAADLERLVDDLADRVRPVAAYFAIAAALDGGGAAGEAFNAGGDEPHSVREVVDLIAAVGGGEVEPEYGPGLPPGEILDQYLDSTKLRELTGWAPAVDLRTGLRRTVEWYREHEEVRP